MKPLYEVPLHPLSPHSNDRLTRKYQSLLSLPRPQRRRLQRQFNTTLQGVALALTLSHSPLSAAADIFVTTSDPVINADGKCSLIEAIVNANDNLATHADCLVSGSGPDTIILRGNTYSVTSAYNGGRNGLPSIAGGTDYSARTTIDNSLTIQGNGATIERAVTTTDVFRLFSNGGNLTLEQTTVSGGGIRFSNSNPYYLADAGGISNSGILTLSDSTVSNNTGHGIASAGKHYETFGSNGQSGDYVGISVTLNNSTVSGNSKSGINLYYGSLTLNDSTISNNLGSGIYVYDGGTTITGSTISGNSNSGLVIRDTVARVTNTTITENTGGAGGGVYAFLDSDLILTSSLISGNTASIGSEMYVGNDGSTQSHFGYNVIGHSGLSNAQAFGFTPYSLGSGLPPPSTPGRDITATSDGSTPTALANILNPTLADNGGATPTHALIAGSPAIDTVPATSCSTSQDQRGQPRPVDGGSGTAKCDSGSFEFSICGTPYSLPHNQWRQISLPCDPGSNNTATNIFGDDELGVYGTDWILWRYNSQVNGYVDMGSDGSLEQGVGYWVIQLSGSEKTLDMPVGSVQTPVSQFAGCPDGESCFEIPLVPWLFSPVPKWHMIGYPFPISSSLGDARLLANSTNCTEGCTLDVAESEDLFNNIFYTYNGTDYTQVNSSGSLSPWTGYWSVTLENAAFAEPVKLLLPKP
ncbi:MAG: right-handed parallel beta-helix repeat-containing protein [Methylococcaceae bacterium]